MDDHYIVDRNQEYQKDRELFEKVELIVFVSKVSRPYLVFK